jgi:hypothetical protein
MDIIGASKGDSSIERRGDFASYWLVKFAASSADLAALAAAAAIKAALAVAAAAAATDADAAADTAARAAARAAVDGTALLWAVDCRGWPRTRER